MTCAYSPSPYIYIPVYIYMLSVCITNWKTTRWSSRRSRDVSRLESVSALFEFTTGRSSTVADSHWNWAGLHGLQNKRQPRPMRQILLETDMIWHVYTKYNIYLYLSLSLSPNIAKLMNVGNLSAEQGLRFLMIFGYLASGCLWI